MDILNLGENKLHGDHFQRVLNQVGWEKEEPEWNRVEFIERQHKKDVTNLNSLKKEINYLEAEKRTIAGQLQRQKTLIMFMADDQKQKEIEHSNETDQLKNQLKNANLKIEELIRRNDY